MGNRFNFDRHTYFACYAIIDSGIAEEDCSYTTSRYSYDVQRLVNYVISELSEYHLVDATRIIIRLSSLVLTNGKYSFADMEIEL